MAFNAPSGRGDPMAVGFARLDARMNRDTEALHDHLWQSKEKKDPTALLSRLRKDASDADAFLQVGGKLRRNAERLIDRIDAPGAGESLFELLEHAWGLGAATVLARRGDFKAAAGRSKNAIASASIGVCANAGCFEYVEEWEAGKVDFETYTGKLADHLEAKGIREAGQFKRLLNATWEFDSNWDASVGRLLQKQAATAAVQAAAWCLLTSVALRRSIGSPPLFRETDFSQIVIRIAGNV